VVDFIFGKFLKDFEKMTIPPGLRDFYVGPGGELVGILRLDHGIHRFTGQNVLLGLNDLF
jgi:hypothetical protein